MEILSFICKELATQEKMVSCFNISTKVAHGADTIIKVMSQFMFIYVIEFQPNLVSSFTPTESCIEKNVLCFKGVLLGLRQFLTIGSPLKMIKNAFHFMLRALFVLKIFTLLT